MTYSDKLEDIPKEHLEGLTTYLNRVRTSSTKYARISTAAAEAGTDEATAHLVLSELVSDGVLQAKLRVRCPSCQAHHGVYAKKSSVQTTEEHCFNCGDEFLPSNRRNWEVIYEIIDDDSDFFPNGIWNVKRYLKSERSLPPSFFESELERFKNLDNPQKRGMDFDYFMGLLFQQLNGVEIRTKPKGNSGEVDVFMSCLSADRWLLELVGSCTVIENKWEKDPIQKDEVLNFHDKASEQPGCEICYFVSMSGFSRGNRKETGALANLRNTEDPPIVDFWSDDVEKMVSDGTPEPLLKEYQFR